MGGTTGLAIAGSEHAVEEFYAMMQERIDETAQARIPMLDGSTGTVRQHSTLSRRAELEAGLRGSCSAHAV